jgi:hypothetical protein
MAAVDNPAPTPPDPLAARYIGTTEVSRYMLNPDPNAIPSNRTTRPLRSRSAVWGGAVVDVGRVAGISQAVVMTLTLERYWFETQVRF